MVLNVNVHASEILSHKVRSDEKMLVDLQKYPDKVNKMLNELGVDSFRGVTQLNIVEPDITKNKNLTHKCTTQITNIINADSVNITTICNHCACPHKTKCKDVSHQITLSNNTQYADYTAVHDIMQESDAATEKLMLLLLMMLDKFNDEVSCYNYPYEARYLIDHVVYLPVHKLVPYSELDKICHAVKLVVKIIETENETRLKAKL